MDRKIRKYRSILGMSGLAVIAFGLWSVIKSTYTSISQLKEMHLTAEAKTIAVIAIIISILISLGLRAFVGFSARAESKGKKKSVLYLIVAGLMIILSLISLWGLLITIGEQSLGDFIIALLVELTSLLSLVELMICSIGLRRAARQTKEE